MQKSQGRMAIMFDDLFHDLLVAQSNQFWRYEMQILISCLIATSATKLFFAVNLICN